MELARNWWYFEDRFDIYESLQITRGTVWRVTGMDYEYRMVVIESRPYVLQYTNMLFHVTSECLRNSIVKIEKKYAIITFMLMLFVIKEEFYL